MLPSDQYFNKFSGWCMKKFDNCCSRAGAPNLWDLHLMIWGGADVIIIEIKYTIHVMCLNYLETNPHPYPCSLEKLSSAKSVPSAKKVRDHCPRKTIGECSRSTVCSFKGPMKITSTHGFTLKTALKSQDSCHHKKHMVALAASLCSIWPFSGQLYSRLEIFLIYRQESKIRGEVESTLRNCCSFLHHLKVPLMLITVEMVVTLPFKPFLYAKQTENQDTGLASVSKSSWSWSKT